MPFLDLIIEPSAPSPHAVAKVQRGLTRLMAMVMHKREDLTFVRVTTSPDAHSTIGGESVPADTWSGRLVAYVTAGTNTEEEKARFIDAAYALLAEHLSTPVSPFYIVVQEVPAASWGYDGWTQADRAKPARESTVAVR